MTFKEKRELSCNMNKLSSKKLGRVVQVAFLRAARLPFLLSAAAADVMPPIGRCG